MNNNQRTEQQQATEMARLLESENDRELTADQRRTIELAQAARDSIHSRLPESNQDLRDLLANQLDNAGDGENEEAQHQVRRTLAVGAPHRLRVLRWVVAASLLVGIIGLFWHSSAAPEIASSMKYQIVPEEIDAGSDDEDELFEPLGEAVDAETIPELMSSPKPVVKFRTENRSRAVPVTKLRTETREETGKDGKVVTREVKVPYTENVTHNYSVQVPYTENIPQISVTDGSSNGLPYFENGRDSGISTGTTVRLPEIATSDSSTVVSVPEGGTILMGGVKRKSDPSVVLYNGQARWEMQSEPAEFLSGKEIAFHFNGREDARYRKQWGGRGERYFGRGEQYAPITENLFVNATGGKAISTFSIDVDTAAYANVRRFLNNGQLPPPNAVRIEELVNYFQYDYPQPTGKVPFSVNMELADCPWNKAHKLLRVALKGREVKADKRPPTNVVFLLDVSGSMTSADKLPLLKRGFKMMVQQLGENDRVTIVTYAGDAGLALEPTTCDQKAIINAAIDVLKPGGSTHGSAGIELAYKMAQQHFIHDGVNKVILATDGDLNVGITADEQLVDLIKEKAAEGVFLTVLGFGTGNLQDTKMEQLADNGNGIYAYIDSVREAKKVLVEEMSGSLVTIAKDVKLQVEFNPAEVRGYRLIGYENRVLRTQDFDNDRKDAGEIGAGHTVTAIYELDTTDKVATPTTTLPRMKYQTSADDQPVSKEEIATEEISKPKLSRAAASGELLTLALRYKEPDSNTSERIEFTIKNQDNAFETASGEFQFAASVAAYGMLCVVRSLRGTPKWNGSPILLPERSEQTSTVTAPSSLIWLGRLRSCLDRKSNARVALSWV